MPRFEAWENELYHHGILGMKWGIRRFQKTDGTLTSAGKKRYEKVGDMSDTELQSRIDRLRMEKEYRDLNKSKIGRAFDKVRTYNKERADNAEKWSKLLSAKASLRQNNPLFRTAIKLGEGGAEALSGAAKKIVGHAGDLVVATLPQTESVATGKKWLLDKGKKKAAQYKQGREHKPKHAQKKNVTANARTMGRERRRMQKELNNK